MFLSNHIRRRSYVFRLLSALINWRSEALKAKDLHVRLREFWANGYMMIKSAVSGRYQLPYCPRSAHLNTIPYSRG